MAWFDATLRDYAWRIVKTWERNWESNIFFWDEQWKLIMNVSIICLDINNWILVLGEE